MEQHLRIADGAVCPPLASWVGVRVGLGTVQDRQQAGKIGVELTLHHCWASAVLMSAVKSWQCECAGSLVGVLVYIIIISALATAIAARASTVRRIDIVDDEFVKIKDREREQKWLVVGKTLGCSTASDPGKL